MVAVPDPVITPVIMAAVLDLVIIPVIMVVTNRDILRMEVINPGVTATANQANPVSPTEESMMDELFIRWNERRAAKGTPAV